MRGARSSVALAVSAGLCAAPAAAARWETHSPPLRRIGSQGVVPLSLHVDYWDRLGWKDRFAQARFTERQRSLTVQSGSRVIYTPGVFVLAPDWKARDLGVAAFVQDARTRQVLQASALPYCAN